MEKKCVFFTPIVKRSSLLKAHSGDPGGEPESGGVSTDAPEDGEPTETPAIPEAGEPLAGEPSAPAPPAPEPKQRFFYDSVGRRYPADEYGQKVFKSRMPKHILQHEWARLSPGERNAIWR